MDNTYPLVVALLILLGWVFYAQSLESELSDLKSTKCYNDSIK